MAGTRVDPPFYKTGTFFLGSLALSLPIYRNFQSNGAKWRKSETLAITIKVIFNEVAKVSDFAI